MKGHNILDIKSAWYKKFSFLPPFCMQNPGIGRAVRPKFVRILLNTFCVWSQVKSTLSGNLIHKRVITTSSPKVLGNEKSWKQHDAVIYEHTPVKNKKMKDRRGRLMIYLGIFLCIFEAAGCIVCQWQCLIATKKY